VSGRLAISPGFEAPPVQPSSAAAPVLQAAAGQTNSPKASSEAKVPSMFANLIQEFANEAAARLPVPATPKTAPRAAQQSTALPGQSAPELPTAQPGPPAPAVIELPPPTPRGGATATAQAAVESTPEAAVKDEDKPAAASPVLSAPAPSEGTRRQPKPEASGPSENSVPITIDAGLFMPVVPPISLKLPSFITHLSEGTGDAVQMGGDDSRAGSTSNPAREQTLDLRPAPALELTIRSQDQPTSQQPGTPAASSSKPSPTDQQTDTELPSALTSGTQPRVAEQIVHAFASAPGPAAIEPTLVQLAPTSTIAIPQTPVNPPPAVNTNVSSAPAPPPQAPGAHLADEPVSRQLEQHAQPLRSLSLEFAPDGAQDVRVRLAERAGDVHISLHSTDPALSGRLSDGVHELVGTLANAGYDAQGWGQSQGRQNHSEQNQSPPDDSRGDRRGNSADLDTEDFDAIMQQPISSKP